MTKMLAATYLDPNHIEPVETAITEPGKQEALVKIYSSGICGSDLTIVSGNHPRATAPLIIGHEFAGEIVELPPPDQSQFQVGDKVTLFPLLSCGHCYACRNGLGHVCSTLRVIGFDRNGGMAEFVNLPIDNLIKLPQTMSYEVGSLLEPLSVAVHAVNMVSIESGKKILVIGAGPIGLLIAMVLKYYDVKEVYITDINDHRLEIAASLGLDTINSLKTNILEYINDKTNGDLADIIFEVAGVQESARQMTELLRPRGSIVNVSVFKKQPVVDMRAVNFKELTIVGSRVYARDDFLKAIEISSQIPLAKIVTHRLPLTEVANAFNLFKEKENVCKVLFKPNQ